MRRLIALVLTVLVLAASGCGEARYHLTVNKDGSGDIDLRVALDSLTLDLLGQVAADPLPALTQVLTREGYTVTSVTEGGQTGIIARKHVPELSSGRLGMAGAPGAEEAQAGPEIQVRRGFYKTRYRFQAEIDPMDFARPRELGGLEGYLLKQMRYEFALSLPIHPDEHNAHSTGDAGKTLVWELIPGQSNQVLVEASRWNAAGLAFSALLVILLGAGVYWYIKRSPGEDSPDE